MMQSTILVFFLIVFLELFFTYDDNSNVSDLYCNIIGVGLHLSFFLSVQTINLKILIRLTCEVIEGRTITIVLFSHY